MESKIDRILVFLRKILRLLKKFGIKGNVVALISFSEIVVVYSQSVTFKRILDTGRLTVSTFISRVRHQV